MVRARFGDVPVLAEKTAHVAARRAHRKNARAGKKMVERLFFDGIHLHGRRMRVSEVIKFAAFVCADETEAGLAVVDMAVARTKIAMNFAARLGFPPAGFVEGLLGFENFQVLHGEVPGMHLKEYYPT